MQLAPLIGEEELWRSAGFRERIGLGIVGDQMGYGHDDAQARSVVVQRVDGLADYIRACLERLAQYASGLDDAALDEIVDESWDPPVSRGVRLISIADDAIQHLAQVAYVVGMPHPGTEPGDGEG